MEYMRVEDLMRDYTTGDGLDWEYERGSVHSLHGAYMERLTADVRANGVKVPVRLDHAEKCVMDGHHRVCAAFMAGLETIPVADAWDGSDWWTAQKVGTLSDDKKGS